MSRAQLIVLWFVLCGACEHFRGYRSCPDPPPALASAPARLSETGIFSEGVEKFTPAFELWSDGAEKRRWIFLPAGAQVDRSHQDVWQFPTGTKFWKEFTRDGVRIETRMLHKIGAAEDQWLAVAYVWNAAGDDAFVRPEGLENAHGTTHDVPAASQCMGCHGGTKSRVLGYSAVQLGQITIPGDAETQRALGYLHANCAHCHNQQRPPRGAERCFDPESELDLSLGSGAFTRLDRWIIPGDPDRSPLIERLVHDGRFRVRMPPLATKIPDQRTIDLLRRWIQKL